MRNEDVGHAGHRNALHGGLALAIGLLACVLTALAPAVASAESRISVTSGFPSPVLLGAPGLSGNVVVRNDNTAPEDTTTICEGQPDCGGIDGITLLPSCSATSGNTCSLAGTDVGVFTVSPTATGSGAACPGRAFTVTTGFDTVGTVRFKPTTGPLVLPRGAACTITFTFTVNRVPVDAVVGTPGLQTRQRIVTAAISDTDEFASTGGSGLVTVGLPAPTVSDTDPDSPANDNSPEIKGTASAAADFMSIYPTANCTGTPVVGEAADFNASGITVNVANDSTTTFSATVTDSGGGVSACSSSTVTYVEDSTPPAVPSVTETVPVSPSSNNSPQIRGTADAGSTVRLYTNDTCTSAVAASGNAAAFTTPGLTVTVASDSTTTFYATATDTAGNVSACSAGRTYVEDSTPPGAPTVSGTDPASPANDNTPQIGGTAPAGTTVTIYTSSNCSGSPVGAGSAAAFGSTGIEVTVADDSTTTFYTKATDPAGNGSPCSGGISYVEDSTAPDGAVISGISPASPVNQNTARVTGVAPVGTTSGSTRTRPARAPSPRRARLPRSRPPASR